MSSRTIKSFTKFGTICLGLPLFLSACLTDFGPYPMPTGYKYHDETYQSQPGGEPVAEKIEHMRVAKSTDRHSKCPHAAGKHPKCEHAMPHHAQPSEIIIEEQIAITGWDNAASELISRLTHSFGTPVEAIYIKAPDAMSMTEISFEKSLRNAAAQQGLNLAPAPGVGPFTLHYAASSMNISDGNRMMLTVTLTDSNGATLAEESGIYSLAPVGGPVMSDVPSPFDEPAYDGVDEPDSGPTPITAIDM